MEVVIKLMLEDARNRTKALKAVAAVDGVMSIAFIGDEIMVTGHGLDPIALTLILRKKVGYAELISVMTEKKRSENKSEVKPKSSHPMEVVIKMKPEDARNRTIASQALAAVDGVMSIASIGDEIMVTGDGLDPIALTLILRKKVGYAELISLMTEKKRRENKSEGKPKSVHPMEVVIKVMLENAQNRTKALKAVAAVDGVMSIAFIGDEIMVTGDGLNPIALTLILRKKVGYAELISVMTEKKRRENKSEGKPKSVNPMEVVIKLMLEDAQNRTKALKAVATVGGVMSIAFIGDEIMVTGDGLDPIALTSILRKKVGYAELISLMTEKKRRENKSEDKPKSVHPEDEELEPFQISSLPDDSFIYGRDEELEPLQISSLPDGSFIYGRENDKRTWVDFILSHVFNDSSPVVMCIVAASGFGKTTMLHLLYNDQSLSDAFDKKVFLCISEMFDERRLMKEVLQSLTCSSQDINELSILEDIVKEELMEKKLLLVLDSAVNQNPSFWDCVSRLINDGAKGSLALVTNQSQMVGDVMEDIHIYHLNNLSYSHCWAILKHHALGGCDRNLSPVLEEIAKKLISKCDYNPLCLRVLGALLSHSVNEDWWDDILENDAWETTTSTFRGDILPALRVCYEYMPTHLKNCFSYCSLFPRGYIFLKHYIIRLWISQGFILSMEGTDPEEFGTRYFDELVQRSFFQHFPIDNAGKGKFVIHELIHRWAENNSWNSYRRSEDGYFVSPFGVSHVSLDYSEPQAIESQAIDQWLGNRSHLVRGGDLQICLFGNRSTSQVDGVFPVLTLVGLNDFFRKFSNIIMLDLSHTNVAELPDSIGLLQRLRFLAINNTKIMDLPRKLFSLVNIQNMEARNCGHLAELPKEISRLSKLRYLDVWKESGHVVMPLGIGKLINLQNLETFNIGNSSSQANVGELNNLNGLRGRLQITGLENVTNIAEAVEANLKNKSKIEALVLQWSGNVPDGRGGADVAFPEELLQNLEPNNNLQELIVRNYTGARFPTWIGDPPFSKLVSIILDSCLNCKKFPDLSELPSLKCLSLRRLGGLRKLIDSGKRSLVERIPRFQSLELLNLWEMYNLEELFEIEDGDFPQLRTISANRCPVLRGVARFPSLVELSFHSCTQLPQIADLPSLEFLKVENSLSIRQFVLPPSLPVLKRLELSYCSELLSVDGMSELTSIEKILIIRCPKIDLLHNYGRYNFKRVNVTRLRQEMHRRDNLRPRFRSYIFAALFVLRLRSRALRLKRAQRARELRPDERLRQEMHRLDNLRPRFGSYVFAALFVLRLRSRALRLKCARELRPDERLRQEMHRLDNLPVELSSFNYGTGHSGFGSSLQSKRARKHMLDDLPVELSSFKYGMGHSGFGSSLFAALFVVRLRSRALRSKRGEHRPVELSSFKYGMGHSGFGSPLRSKLGREHRLDDFPVEPSSFLYGTDHSGFGSSLRSKRAREHMLDDLPLELSSFKYGTGHSGFGSSLRSKRAREHGLDDLLMDGTGHSGFGSSLRSKRAREHRLDDLPVEPDLPVVLSSFMYGTGNSGFGSSLFAVLFVVRLRSRALRSKRAREHTLDDFLVKPFPFNYDFLVEPFPINYGMSYSGFGSSLFVVMFVVRLRSRALRSKHAREHRLGSSLFVVLFVVQLRSRALRSKRAREHTLDDFLVKPFPFNYDFLVEPFPFNYGMSYSGFGSSLFVVLFVVRLRLRALRSKCAREHRLDVLLVKSSFSMYGTGQLGFGPFGSSLQSKRDREHRLDDLPVELSSFKYGTGHSRFRSCVFAALFVVRLCLRARWSKLDREFRRRFGVWLFPRSLGKIGP